MTRTRFFWFSTILAAVLCFASMVQGQAGESSRVTFAGVTPATALRAGKTSEVVLHFTIVPGFHINSNAPKSDLLIPTTLKIDPAGMITPKNIVYAEGKDVSFPFDPDNKLNVYSGEFTVRASLSVPSNAPVGATSIHAELHYQACSDRACFPPKALPLDFDVTVERR